jgi:hypothetical protein
VQGVLTSGLPTSLLWVAQFFCQQLMGSLHAAQLIVIGILKGFLEK